MIPLSVSLEKSSAGYSLSPGGPKINQTRYMDDLKLYGKTQEELEELVTVADIFSTGICMEFGIETCATLKMEGGKKKEGIGVTLPSGEVLKDHAEEGYRYLEILESDLIRSFISSLILTDMFFFLIFFIFKHINRQLDEG